MSKKEIKKTSDLIRPDMLDVSEHWWNSFGNNEREISARLFTKVCQKHDSWTVTMDQLNEIEIKGNFWFNGLLNEIEGWIVEDENGHFTASHRFICHCFGMFPAKK